MNTKIRADRLFTMYKKLFHAFGPQGWWPVTPSPSWKPVYGPGKSLRGQSESEKFEICLGSFLTQNTSWGNVEKVLSRLKKENVLGFDALKKLPLSKLEKFFRSSGYFRQKARRIKNFLSRVESEGNSFSRFFSGPFPRVRRKLLSMNGVGPETADSILLYAAGVPIFVVDAYTRRIGARWGLLKGGETYDEIQGLFMKRIPRSLPLYGEFHALLVKLGKDYCLKKSPVCLPCPVRKECRFGSEIFKTKNQQEEDK